jgi:hypothetical protein
MNDLAVIEAPIVVYETEKDFQKRVRNLHRLQKIVCTMDNGLKSAMRVAQALTVMVQRKLHRLSGGETPQEYVTGTLLFAKSDTHQLLQLNCNLLNCLASQEVGEVRR